MKKYTVKPNEDLGSVARKFWLPSWKYLYEINKEVIGDNPDLLKEGTKLEIPQWDSTTGDEKIKEKGAEPFEYCNGLRYAYPWVPLSYTLSKPDNTLYEERDKNGKLSSSFEKEKEFKIIDGNSKVELGAGKIKTSEDIEILVPDAKIKFILVDGKLFK